MTQETQTDPASTAIIERIVQRVGKRIILGLPLGLGKPNRLANALYRHARGDASIDLEIVTALSLDPPQPVHWLEKRLMEPVIERMFGADYPRLQYLTDGTGGNVQLTEFYFQSGAALGNAAMQRRYIASNYTHVARDLVDRGVNLILQLVARDADGRLSLSCNPDVTLDLFECLRSRPGHRVYRVAQIHPDLPFMHGDAVVSPDDFDEIIDTDPRQPLFAVPRERVSLQDHAIGLHASRLIADGGTLQIGIGSLSDALVHSLILRHCDNAIWNDAAAALLRPLPNDIADDGPFTEGLYGASEMFMDGFMHLYCAGILAREVFDDLAMMERANSGGAVEEAGNGPVMEGGFFLGSQSFYDFLNALDEKERQRFRMHGVGRINQLYGGHEALAVAQRRRARFVNSCMMMTATGAAVSHGLADYQVVSGVGGQYNFVAMAHAMDDGRSILLLRANRESSGELSSNIVWQYPHITIPAHLRDLVVTEYGVADLRGKTDEQCIQAMIEITDARFQDEIANQAKNAGKLDPAWNIPDMARSNTPEQLRDRLSPFIQHDQFPPYPFGSDFTPVEQRLIPALKALKRLKSSRWGLARAALSGQPEAFPEELERLGLAAPATLRERLTARTIAAMLAHESN